MHELLRGYAAEKLATRPHVEFELRTRHCTTYASALERWGEELRGPRQLIALGEMDLEIDNARAAWDWAVDQGQIERLGPALEGVFIFYEWRARYVDAEVACQVAAETLAESRAPGALRVRSRILAWQGVINRHMGRATPARQLAEESLSLLQRPEFADQDTRRERAAALKDLGWLTAEYRRHDADLREALRLLEKSLAMSRALGDRWETAHVLYFLGCACVFLGDRGAAQEMHQESLTIFRELGDERLAAYPLMDLGRIFANQGQVETGERLARESLTILRQTDDQHVIELAMRLLAWILYAQGKNTEAHSLLEEHIRFCEDLGIRRYLDTSHFWLGTVKLHMGQYEDARSEASVSLALVQEQDVPHLFIQPAGLLGEVELAKGAYAEALPLLRESVARWREIGHREWTSSYLSSLAIACYGLGRLPQARKFLAEALQIAVDIRAPLPLTHALPALALLLSGQGELERAVELYALALRYPFVANSVWWEDVVGKHIATAAASLPPDVVAASEERGRARDLWSTAEKLLVELKS
jgi:tetratricopeptide (TPR) repeat protein